MEAVLRHISWCELSSAKSVYKHNLWYADHGILPDEEIVVVNTHIHDDEDLESFFSVASSSKVQQERGFTGTALSSHGLVAGAAANHH